MPISPMKGPGSAGNGGSIKDLSALSAKWTMPGKADYANAHLV
jgi:hypothetical protein